jgi:hypothetical protein
MRRHERVDAELAGYRTKRKPKLIMLPSNGAQASTVHRPPGPGFDRTNGW